MKPVGLWYTTGLLSVLGLAQPSTAESTGFVELPLKREKNQPTARELAKRATGASLKRAWDNDTYTVNVDIGTPKQSLHLAVDVGTYVTWVNSDCDSVLFKDWKEGCEAAGIYNESLSTTNEYLSTPEGHEWLNNDDGSSWSMSYATDDFTIQGASTLKNVTIAVYDYHDGSENGALGLGWGRGVNTNYSNIVDELVAQGVMQTKAFSLALGDKDGIEAGSLVLGGVDTKKFSGALQKVPVIEPPTYPIDYSEYRYWTNVDGVTLRSPEGSESTFPGFQMMVHSTDEISYLPDDIVNTIAAAFGIHNTSDDAREWYMVPCRQARQVQGSLDLQFGGLNVSIPYKDLVFGSTQVHETEYEECVLSTFPWDRTSSTESKIDFYYLGHSFLRAVYAVFDQDGRSVWLARRNECGSDIKAITAEEGFIAGMKGQCDGDAGLDPSKAGGSGKDEEGESSGVRHGLSAKVLAVCLAAWLWMGL